MAVVTIGKADHVTATFGATAIANVQDVTIGDETLEALMEFGFFTGTGKNAQAAGSNVIIGDTTITATLDTTTYNALDMERATGCTATIVADLVIVVCYAGVTATLTLADMALSGKTGLTIGKNAEIPIVYTFQHQDLDGTGTYITAVIS